MKHFVPCVVSFAFALTAWAPPASAQLLVGMDDPEDENATNAFHVDLAGSQASPLWCGIEVWGLAVDDLAGIVYCNDGPDLFSWSYNQPTPPALLGTITEAGTGVSLSVVSLSFAGGKLYATRNATTEAFYEIDLGTLEATNVLTYPASFDFGGTAFNPSDGLFYGTNDAVGAPSGAGIYSIDVLGGITDPVFVAAYPAGVSDVDGCAVGDDKVWLVEDEPSLLHNYDLIGASYDPTPPPSPIPTTEVFAGAAWAPSLVPATSGVAYCTAKTNSCGTAPFVSAVGTPSASATAGFVIMLDNAKSPFPNQNPKAGVLLYSVTGPNNVPFQGGFLCVAGPIQRTIFRAPETPGVGGTCSAQHSLDMNAYARGLVPGSTPPDPLLSVCGTRVWTQWFARDTVGNGALLSDGWTYVVHP